MKAIVMGTVCEGSRCWESKDGKKQAALRVFDGEDVTQVRCDPKFVEGPEAVPVGASVRIVCILRAWDKSINAESLNGVEVVTGK